MYIILNLYTRNNDTAFQKVCDDGKKKRKKNDDIDDTAITFKNPLSRVLRLNGYTY